MVASAQQFGSPRSPRGRARLALWVLAPLVGLVVVIAVVASLPSVDCGEGGGASDAQEAVVLAITALVSLAAFAAAAVRLRGLRRAGGSWAAHRTVFLVGIGAVLLSGLAVALARAEFAYFFVGAGLAGMLLTGIALLGVLVVWVGGRGVDGAGGLLPLYLLGAGLFCYPVVVLLGLFAQSGVGC